MTSVIVCFYNRLNHLRCCLDSLKLCSGDFDEVVIADDGTDRGVVSRLKNMLKNYDFPIKHVWQPKKSFRVARARNNGIRNSRGDFLIFLDCDYAILPDTLKRHLEARKPKRFSAAHFKYLNREQTRKVFESKITEELLKNLYRNLPERKILRTHYRYLKHSLLARLHLYPARKQNLCGHFSIFRKDIEYVNGFDENFVGWGGEDKDLGIRLVKAGIYCKPLIRQARALHLWHSPELGNKKWEEGTNIKYFYRKNIPYYCKNGLNKHSPTQFNPDYS